MQVYNDIDEFVPCGQPAGGFLRRNRGRLALLAVITGAAVIVTVALILLNRPQTAPGSPSSPAASSAAR